MSTNNPVCQTGCSNKQPVFNFSLCDPKTQRGQIDKIYIASDGATPFVDWTALPEWLVRLDNTDVASVEKIRFLYGIGEKPEASGDAIELSLQRKVILDKTHTINFDVDEVTQENYDALRQYECGGNVKLWYGADEYLWGGNDGIDAFIQANYMIPRGRKELQLIKLVITWDAKFHPEMTTNPMI